MKKNYLCLLTGFLTFSIAVFNYASAQQSSMGTDFWMGFNDFFSNAVTLKLTISSDVAASGTIAVPGQSYSAPFTVTANSTTTVTIPTATVYAGNSEVITARAIHITSDNPVGIIATTNTAVRTETSVILPTSSLGTEYYTACYGPGTFNFNSEFMVVATTNNTIIDITPSAVTKSGKPANVTFSVTLNAGEEYQVKASSSSGTKDLTGSRIAVSASNPCNKIAVFSGMDDGYVPVNKGTADPLYEQMYPLNIWGTDYVVPPFYSAGTDTSQVRIIAAQNNTSVTVDGGAPFILNAGQFTEQTFDHSVHCISADKPVEVAQYMRSNSASGATPNKGDPSMIILNPNNQTLNKYVFSPYNSFMASRYANVVMKTAYTGQFKLDGAPAGTFTASPCSGYSCATVALTAAFHTLSADSGFIGYIYGYGTGDESFANSLGWSNASGAPVLSMAADTTTICKTACTNVSAFTTPGFSFNYTWSPNIGSGAGPFNVCPSATTTYSVTAASACDTLTQAITINVVTCSALPVADFQASDTTLCANDCISYTDLSANATSWQWSFAGGNPLTSTDQNPFVCYPAQGNYDVKLVASNSGGSDSITFNYYIAVIMAPPTPVITQDGTTLYCSTDPTYISYQWFDSTALIPGATDTSLVITHGGNYNIQVTNTNNCKTATGINIILGIQHYISGNAIFVSPNPVGDQFTVSGLQFTGASDIDIYNVLGEKMYSSSLFFEKGKGEIIAVSGLSQGIYFVQVISEHGRWVGRFVKE